MRGITKKTHKNIFIVVVYSLRLQFFLIQVLVYSHTCQANLLQTKMVNVALLTFNIFIFGRFVVFFFLIHQASFHTLNKASKKENKCPVQVTRGNQNNCRRKKMTKINLPKIGYFNRVDNKRFQCIKMQKKRQTISVFYSTNCRIFLPSIYSVQIDILQKKKNNTLTLNLFVSHAYALNTSANKSTEAVS